MSGPEQFIGNQVSLISKIDIRYEGTLAEVDLPTSKLKLLNVRSFGTEGRKKDGPQIPPMDTVYESVIFNGYDIKALNFVSNNNNNQAPQNPAVYNDPAIIQSQVQNQSSPVINPLPSYPSTQQQITNLPPFNPSLSSFTQIQRTSPQFTDLLLYQPSGLTITTSSSQNTQQIPVLPMYQKPNLTVAIPDSSSTIGGQQITNLPLYHPYLSTSSAESAPPAKITDLPLPSSYLASHQTNPQPPPVHNFSTGTMTSNVIGTVPQQTSVKAETNPNSNTNPSSTESDEYEIERPVRTGTNRSRNGPLLPNPSRNKPILPLPNRGNKSHNNWRNGPGQYGRSASYNQHYNRGRGRGGARGYNNNTHNQFGGNSGGRGKVVKFTEEFDFEAMNEKFNKDEVWGQLGRSNSHREDSNNNNNEDDDDSNDDDDDVSFDEAYYHSDDQSQSIKLAYKKDDFFDSLSSGQQGGPKFSDQIKLDTETFGHVPRYRNGGRRIRVGRSHYNRGGRYYHNNNNGYNNYNRNPISETNPNRNRNRGNNRGGYYVRRED